MHMRCASMCSIRNTRIPRLLRTLCSARLAAEPHGAAGVHCWCALLVCTAGVHCWCALLLLVCTAGAHCWCALLLCTAAVYCCYALLLCTAAMHCCCATPVAHHSGELRRPPHVRVDLASDRHGAGGQRRRAPRGQHVGVGAPERAVHLCARSKTRNRDAFSGQAWRQRPRKESWSDYGPAPRPKTRARCGASQGVAE